MRAVFASLALMMVLVLGASAQSNAPAGFTSLFNGKDLTGWRIPQGDNGHWRVVDGTIDYDARSEATGDKALWSEKEYRDLELRVDWRLKDVPYKNPNVPIIMPDGTHKKGADGKDLLMTVPDGDSGIYLRGLPKAQVNIWNWPIGSGEVYGYRTDEKQPAAVRAGVTPKTAADHNIGEWNTFVITLRGDRLSVVLNGKTVLDNAQLPGVPPSGRIALQHHGEWKDGAWTSPPSVVQFRNIYVKEL
jgi:hypothetical protein